jgi:hypothetical protein
MVDVPLLPKMFRIRVNLHNAPSDIPDQVHVRPVVVRARDDCGAHLLGDLVANHIGDAEGAGALEYRLLPPEVPVVAVQLLDRRRRHRRKLLLHRHKTLELDVWRIEEAN